MNNTPFFIADGEALVAVSGSAEASAAAAAPAEAAPAAQETAAAETGAPAGAPKPQPSAPGWTQLLPFVIIFALFYFMMIRPQQRKEKERRRMIEELRAGAKIVFAGGIVGTIAEATEKTFVVETTDGKMEILRSCVQGVLGAEAAK
jgi:preprotein translocase subunit YajC